jgi:hypothetical protein
MAEEIHAARRREDLSGKGAAARRVKCCQEEEGTVRGREFVPEELDATMEGGRNCQGEGVAARRVGCCQEEEGTVRECVAAKRVDAARRREELPGRVSCQKS